MIIKRDATIEELLRNYVLRIDVDEFEKISEEIQSEVNLIEKRRE